jgi:hypothetical protein
MVGLGGLEPPTSRLSGVRSNQAELQAQKEAPEKQQRVRKGKKKAKQQPPCSFKTE